MSGHTPGLPSVIYPCPSTAEEQERMRDRAWTDLRNADPTLHAEIVRRWNAHADLLAALREAQGSLAAVAGLLATYPRPSNDPHGRTLLDSMEHAKAASHAARAAIAKAGGA